LKVKKVDNIYDRLKSVLENSDCNVGASEAHGILFGLMTGPQAYDERVWFSCLAESEDVFRDSLEADSAKFLSLLADISAEVLRAGSGIFLLLPKDDINLSIRVSEFSKWCQGYLYGLGISGFNRDNLSVEPCLSFLSDLERFCRLDEDLIADEEGEKALVELYEFTRVGIMTIYEELKSLKRKFTPKRDIH
jgi:hypothetical protein